MNFGLNDDQQMLRDTFARFLDSESSMARVRAAQETNGFDRALWQGLAELGTFAMRVPEDAGGLGLGTLDATLVAEEAGRTLASGPVVEALVAARLLGQLGGPSGPGGDLLEGALDGSKLVTIAFQDVAAKPVQWLAGGANADAVIARKGDYIVAVTLGEADRKIEENLASNGIGEADLAKAPTTVLASGTAALDAFAGALEEWKLLAAAQLNGLAREAVRLAAAYACERVAFGVPIGTFQAISHPLANFITEVDGGKYFTWKAIHEIATGEKDAGAHVPLALWWNAKTAARAAIQGLLRTIEASFAPTSLAIGGFSQGAMLALDVALAGEPPVAKVAVLSGVLLADSLPALHAGRARPAVFAAHGRQDGILAFEGGERAQAMLRAHGLPVTWSPFSGGHEIPEAIVEQLRGFLFDP